MNTYVPFICLFLGAVINWKGLPTTVLKACDGITNMALFLLMLIIGLNIGTSNEVMSNLGIIFVNCVVISVLAVACSVFIVLIAEKTVMPLEKIRLELANQEMGEPVDEKESENSGFSLLVIIMPSCILIGILIGCFAVKHDISGILDIFLTLSLILLYTGVGISIGSNKEVFAYIKKLGIRVLFMPASIFAGCVISGILSGLILKLPYYETVIPASGMGYYSLTGAYLTETYGIEAGSYGFIVNVLRDVITVATLPLLIKISKGSPIASGAAGCMDTMLVPVTKFVGPELGMVALISGTILTFAVPIWLPLSGQIF